MTTPFQAMHLEKIELFPHLKRTEIIQDFFGAGEVVWRNRDANLIRLSNNLNIFFPIGVQSAIIHPKKRDKPGCAKPWHAINDFNRVECDEHKR